MGGPSGPPGSRLQTMASIAVDVMSGDSGAPELIPGALLALDHDPDLELILVGKPDVIDPVLAAAPAAVRARVTVHPAATVVGMYEHPREAIRKRKDSSMRIAIDLVKEGRAGAMVSAGNTGALTAISHFVLKTVGPVERAPIMSAVPARNGGHTHMLDLGANTKASADTARAVRHHGFDRRARCVRRCQSARRPAQHRRGRHQGPRDRPGGARVDPRRAASTTWDSSRATISSTRAWTWWSPTASRATWRSSRWKASPSSSSNSCARNSRVTCAASSPGC